MPILHPPSKSAGVRDVCCRDYRAIAHFDPESNGLCGRSLRDAIYRCCGLGCACRNLWALCARIRTHKARVLSQKGQQHWLDRHLWRGSYGICHRQHAGVRLGLMRAWSASKCFHLVHGANFEIGSRPCGVVMWPSVKHVTCVQSGERCELRSG